MKRWQRLAAAAVVCVAVPQSNSCVASTLLAEFRIYDLRQDFRDVTVPLPSEIQFQFIINDALIHTDAALWFLDTTAASVGQTFVADAATTAAFQNLLTSDRPLEIQQLIATEFGTAGPPDLIGLVSDLFTGGINTADWHAQAFVPQLGPNFSGYTFDRIERTINFWSVTRPPGMIRWEGEHTVRIFGVVPEPTTAFLLATVAVLLACNTNRTGRK